MQKIRFTQYLRPHGGRETIYTERPDHIVAMADDIIKRGYVFEVETLTTGEVSLTIADPAEGIDVAIRVVPNGPQVPEAIDDMISRFYRQMAASLTSEGEI